jgi:hypothetical protein
MLARYGDGPTIPSVVVAGNKGRGMTIVSLLGISPLALLQTRQGISLLIIHAMLLCDAKGFESDNFSTSYCLPSGYDVCCHLSDAHRVMRRDLKR